MALSEQIPHAPMCWAHARRPFFMLADLEQNARRKARGAAPAGIAPIALDMVQRIDALFEFERGINGQDAGQRLAARRELSAPLGSRLIEPTR